MLAILEFFYLMRCRSCQLDDLNYLKKLYDLRSVTLLLLFFYV
jgi:hypothetical protein